MYNKTMGSVRASALGFYAKVDNKVMLLSNV